jgi:hypothetical protein
MGAVTTCVASTAQGLSALLSQYFQVLGVRFVFDPGNDLKDVNNQTANTYSTASWAAADMVSGDASKLLYGKMAIALAAGYVGGELSSGDNVEYDPNLIIDPIVGPYPLPNPCPSTGPCGFPVTPNERLPDYQNDITVPKDPGGLPRSLLLRPDCRHQQHSHQRDAARNRPLPVASAHLQSRRIP